MTRAPSPDRTGLPAPYRNPWLSLAEALRAVAADSRLRARQLWRRNGDGSLWRPPWWPQPLAAWFWPVLGAAAVALLLTAAVLLPRQLSTQPLSPQPVAPASPAASASPAAPDSAAAGADLAESGVTEAPLADRAAQKPLADRAGEEPAAAPLPPETDLQAVVQAEPVLPPAPADPLDAVLASDGFADLVLRADPEPDNGLLRLHLQPAFARLPAGERQGHAQVWQQLLQELGYDHLELIDPSGRLLARDALVGGGMIMLNPPPSA